MKRTEPQSIGEVMRQAIDSLNMREGLDKARAVDAWQKIAGQHLGAACGRPTVRGNMLIIPVDSAALRQELNLRRSSILRDINARVGSEIISEIRFVGTRKP